MWFSYLEHIISLPHLECPLADAPAQLWCYISKKSSQIVLYSHIPSRVLFNSLAIFIMLYLKWSIYSLMTYLTNPISSRLWIVSVEGSHLFFNSQVPGIAPGMLCVLINAWIMMHEYILTWNAWKLGCQIKKGIQPSVICRNSKTINSYMIHPTRRWDFWNISEKWCNQTA